MSVGEQVELRKEMDMEIVKYPNPILTTPCVEVEINDETRKLAQDMFAFMKSLTWGSPVGLAASQVGHNLRMFWALDNLYINPVITSRSPAMEHFKEGCYSLDEGKFDYKVVRHKSIYMLWQDKKGRSHERNFTGFPAQVIQHEYDHIEGKLCIDY
ncbi:MAG TPA: peptide deformylase [Pedobacter sp.]